MEEPMNLKEYNANFYFYFIGPNSLPTSIDPRIGQFFLSQNKVLFENGFLTKNEKLKIELREVNFETDREAASLIRYFKDIKGGGVYAPKDLSQLQVFASMEDGNQ